MDGRSSLARELRSNTFVLGKVHSTACDSAEGQFCVQKPVLECYSLLMVDLSGVPAPQPVTIEATHKSKHRHKDKKHKHRHRDHVSAEKRHRSGEQQAVGVAKGRIALAADYNSDPESGELSDTTRLAQKEAEREHQSRLRAAEAPAPQAAPAASAPGPGALLSE